MTPEVGGRLLHFTVQEGERLEAGQAAAQIDTTQAHLERMQLVAQREAVRSRLVTIRAQEAVYREQIAVATRELERTERMLAGNAATQKQYDDLSGQIRILERQLESVDAQRANVNAEMASIEAGIARIEDRIARSSITNPVAGTVLARYAEAFELVAAGRPLYRIADLETMFLRVFVSGTQLQEVKIGAAVRVLIDGADGSLQELPGEVSWISDKAEFTPRIIQTREERVNLVYAIKIRVRNPDGQIKIGMPGEVVFTPERHPEGHPDRHPERSSRSEATRTESKGVGGFLKASRGGTIEVKPGLACEDIPIGGTLRVPPRASTSFCLFLKKDKTALSLT
ncbi:MAG: HlyD family efflux transporter periplasmic adaptor subunit [Rhodothermaceae bacterium]|nr:HlyD family efflux transporter periplasmic adaptor subunit [Rhodothermaceae bacterium]